MSGQLIAAALALVLLGSPAPGKDERKGILTDNRIIQSEHLGYKLQYRVYLPPGHESLSGLPALYVTDGQWYIEPGGLPRWLDRMIGKKAIEPVVAVFIDNRDPDDLSDNRRQREFFCNREYIRFIGLELTREIDRDFPTRPHRNSRTALGLSFGGLNSACMGLLAHDDFTGFAMQSPALWPVPNVLEGYRQAPKRGLRFFLSTGHLEGNAKEARELKRILEKKGEALFYKEVPQGHDWNNWRPLLRDVLKFFYGTERRQSKSGA